MTNKLVIAIDGPSSSGKGTIAKLVANHFDLPYLNTGALYRKLAYDALELGLDLEKDEDKIIKLILKMDLSDLESEKIHNEEIGKSASIIAKNQNIRSALLYLQKNFASNDKGAVMDGRDIGTVICPDADFKFFITASNKERAKRRYLQLKDKNLDITQEMILKQLEERDLRDKNRTASPFVKADDAVEIDTSDLTINQVFAKILSYIDKF